MVRFNGLPAVTLGLVKQANPLDISDGFEAAWADVKELLPNGMNMTVANDNSQFIRESIDNVFTATWEAVVLVILIIFIFIFIFIFRCRCARRTLRLGGIWLGTCG